MTRGSDDAHAAEPRVLSIAHSPVRTVECHECGMRQTVGPLADGESALCPRCNAGLRTFRARSLQHAAAFSAAGLVFLAGSAFLPFMGLKIGGRVQDADLVTGAITLYRDGQVGLTAVVLATTVLAPLLKLGATLWVLVGLTLKRPPRHLPHFFRRLHALHPWAMIEVYLLGVCVAYVKLIDLASIQIGPALYCLVGLMLTMIAGHAALDEDAVWEAMERRGLVPPAPPVGRRTPAVACHACALLVPHDCAVHRPGAHAPSCPRCGAALHRRKVNSVPRAWALLIAAVILYIPANVLPVMTVIMLGAGAPDTIMSGVVELLESGMWPLAALVFFASITVPVLKLIGMAILLESVRRRSRVRLRDRARLYRIIESVGRWSMVDIFMLSILVALVRIGALATIEPGLGASAFASVVILTMIGAMAFDPRLMWDAAGENRD